MRLNLFQQEFLSDRELIPALGVFGYPIQALVDTFQIGEHQFGRNRLDIANGIDGACHMMDVRIFETADDLDDGIDFPDVA